MLTLKLKQEVLLFKEAGRCFKLEPTGSESISGDRPAAGSHDQAGHLFNTFIFTSTVFILFTFLIVKSLELCLNFDLFTSLSHFTDIWSEILDIFKRVYFQIS